LLEDRLKGEIANLGNVDLIKIKTLKSGFYFLERWEILIQLSILAHFKTEATHV